VTDLLLHSFALLCVAVSSGESPKIAGICLENPRFLDAEFSGNASANTRMAETAGGSESPALNVLLLSVDTLRADYLGCYGHPLPASPHIDRLAQESLVFEDCVCEVPLTCPSFCAMLTSRMPRMIGTPRNGLRLSGEIPLVTEQFHNAGYYTFCVQSNWTLKKKLSGLDRGFDVYEDDFHKKRWGVIKPERPADEVTRVALACLAKRDPDRPFFAWIHYTDPHAPYQTHKGFNPAGKRAWGQGKTRRVRVAYNSEVA